jgi:hypothetical protein
MSDLIIDNKKQYYKQPYKQHFTITSLIKPQPLNWKQFEQEGIPLSSVKLSILDENDKKYYNVIIPKDFIKFEETSESSFFGLVKRNSLNLIISIPEADKLIILLRMDQIKFWPNYSLPDTKNKEKTPEISSYFASLYDLDFKEKIRISKWFEENRENWIKAIYKAEDKNFEVISSRRGLIKYKKEYDEQKDVLLLYAKHETIRSKISGQITVWFAIDNIPVKIEIRDASKLLAYVLDSQQVKIKKLLSSEGDNFSFGFFFMDIQKNEPYPTAISLSISFYDPNSKRRVPIGKNVYNLEYGELEKIHLDISIPSKQIKISPEPIVYQ